jgi:perosamine synthetase
MSDLQNFLVDVSSNIKDALTLINKNSYGICFVTLEKKLVGVLTDGDIRRALINNTNLEDSVEKSMNTDFVAMHIETPSKEVRKKISNQIRVIPLLDSDGQIVDISNIKKTHAIPLMEPSFLGNESEYVNDCLETGWISSKGKYVNKFEKSFEELHNDMFAVSVSNGTVALQLAMLALDIKQGDEVIVPNITFAASVNSIIHCGATPVLCEIDPLTWCLDSNEVKKLITSRTKAIMPVHLYGQVCQMEEISQLANENDLYVIEDCAEALGSLWKGKRVGTFGEAATFSFFGNKTITTGEGGMVLFKNKEVSIRAKTLRDHGMNSHKRYWHDVIGYNFRLTNIQAAIGVAQLEKLDDIVQKKIHIGHSYSKLLKNHELIDQVPELDNNIVNSYWIFSLLLKNKNNRDEIVKRLLELGVETRPVFYPLHEMPPYKNLKKSQSLSNSIHISKYGLSLPSATSLTNVNIKYIVYCLDKIASL